MCDDKGAEVVQVQFRDSRVSNDRKIPRTAAAGGCWISKLRSDYSESRERWHKTIVTRVFVAAKHRHCDAGNLVSSPDTDTSLVETQRIPASLHTHTGKNK